MVDRLAALQEFLKEDPDDPFLRFALASEYLKRGDEAAALETFRALVDGRPDYVGTYYHLGKLYRHLDQKQRAAEIFEAGIREAQRQGDRHSESELRTALLEIDEDLD